MPKIVIAEKEVIQVDKGLPALLRNVMIATVVTMTEEGEIDESRAVLWIESHAVKLSKEGSAYKIEIVEVAEEEDADRS